MGEASTGTAERSLPTISWLGCTLCFFRCELSSPLARFLLYIFHSMRIACLRPSTIMQHVLETLLSCHAVTSTTMRDCYTQYQAWLVMH